MKLNLKQLQVIAKEAMLENKLAVALKADVVNVFGHSIVTENCSLEEVARQINDLLETNRRIGKELKGNLKTTILVQMMQRKSPEVRKVAAQLLPERLALKLAYDRDSGVRAKIARRAPVGVVIEMCNKFPHDDNLQTIKAERLLREFDAKNLQKLKSTESDLSDSWYYQQARKLIDDYGELSYGLPRRVDRLWKVQAVKRLCDSLKSSYNIDIDAKKLLQIVDELLEELDVIRNPSLKEIKQQLLASVKQDLINETRILPMLSEEDDIVTQLYKCRSSSDFMSRFEEAFKVKSHQINGELKTKMLQEGIVETMTVPVRAFLPQTLDERVEKVLNAYVNVWNHLNENAVFALCWNIDPQDDSIVFGANLK